MLGRIADICFSFIEPCPAEAAMQRVPHGRLEITMNESFPHTIEDFRHRLAESVTNDAKRKRLQFISIYLLFATVSLFMSILNILTDKGTLTLATLYFTIFCLIDYLVLRGMPVHGHTVSSVLFMGQIIALFTFFIVSGNPDGFSVIWITMLPACGMLLFGRALTGVLCSVMLVILIFFFRIPAGISLLMYDYNETFRMRFPILFIAAFLLSLLLESIRATTQHELTRMRENYQYLYLHDSLTGLLNRYGLYDWKERVKPSDGQSVLMFDIDIFKSVNDTYGHDAGDVVLSSVSAEACKYMSSPICRWGGEEFVVWFPDGNMDKALPERLRAGIEALSIPACKTEDPIHVTISIGVAAGGADTNLDELINHADACLYTAKRSGRNRVVFEQPDASGMQAMCS